MPLVLAEPSDGVNYNRRRIRQPWPDGSRMWCHPLCYPLSTEQGLATDNEQAMFRVKICGITTAIHGRQAVEAGADAIGLNFFPESRRYVTLDQADAIVVPQDAIHSDKENEEEEYVWVVDPDDASIGVQRKNVKTGQRSGKNIEIIAGLKVGDLISLEDEQDDTDDQ